jgi:hypothetical protein
MMTGRPSSFTQEIAETICFRLMEGESLREICAEAEMPNQTTVHRWLAGNEEFRLQYAQAREIQADTFCDETKVIADDGTNDWMEKFGRDGKAIGWEVNGEAVMRSKLRVDQRKWHASKLNPKKYGDRQEIRHADPDGQAMAPAQVFVTIAGGTDAV